MKKVCIISVLVFIHILAITYIQANQIPDGMSQPYVVPLILASDSSATIITTATLIDSENKLFITTGYAVDLEKTTTVNLVISSTLYSVETRQEWTNWNTYMTIIRLDTDENIPLLPEVAVSFADTIALGSLVTLKGFIVQQEVGKNTFSADVVSIRGFIEKREADWTIFFPHLDELI
ncbi:hypothetical protein MYX06_05265, partial [Patescibacteria group bacterium AH-259-L05]|nr:hypothetical protein [Patescibacteria group bacterium AH-259-L05]